MSKCFHCHLEVRLNHGDGCCECENDRVASLVLCLTEDLATANDKLDRAEAVLTSIAQYHKDCGNKHRRKMAAKYFKGRTPKIVAVLENVQRELELLRAAQGQNREH